MSESIPSNPQQTPKPRKHRPRLTPISLLEYLQHNPSASLGALTAHFHCSLDKLSEIFNNPDFLKRHKLQTQLAYLQSRLAANLSLPDAMAKTIALMHESEKPEVARRAAAALIQIAGLPIRTAMQPAPAPIPEPPNPPAPPAPDEKPMLPEEVKESQAASMFVQDLITDHGINMPAIESQFRDQFVDHLRKFCTDHNIPKAYNKYAS